MGRGTSCGSSPVRGQRRRGRSGLARRSYQGIGTDTQRKSERYTRAVSALKDHLDWWASLGEVERASKPSITHLVTKGEQIITEEQSAWTSTIATKKTAAAEAEGAAGDDEEMHAPFTPSKSKVAPA